MNVCSTHPLRSRRARWALLLLLPVSLPLWAAVAEAPAALPWGDMAMGLFGGLAIFLYGMDMLAHALKATAGDRMRNVLARLTSNRFMGAATGAVVTAVIQSSSVTTVLVIGFISANLMTLSQAVGVIMGANIGTTITAQIVAFKVTKFAMVMIAAGFALDFFIKNERWRYYGQMLMGLGLIFLGMTLMGDAMYPLRDYAPFLQLMREMEAPWLGILVAALFTGLVQSSSATTGIVIVMASQGFITLPAGIALAFGANIGTCVTALLASIGKPREATRAAAVHVLFNVAGVLVWVGLIDHLARISAWLSPAATQLEGMARLAAETPRQIANANTLFNLLNTALFIGFTPQIAALVKRLMPDRPVVAGPPEVEPKYLDAILLDTPSMALEAVRRELTRMGERVDHMMERILPALIEGNEQALRAVAKMDNEVDILHGHVVRYLGEVGKTALTEVHTRELVSLLEAVNDLENIGDIIETNLVAQGLIRLKEEFTVSLRTRKVLEEVHGAVAEAVREAIQAVSELSEERARRVVHMKLDINRLLERAHVHQAERLVSGEPHRVAAYRVEMDSLEHLRRIYYFAKRMARAVTPEQEKGMNLSE